MVRIRLFVPSTTSSHSPTSLDYESTSSASPYLSHRIANLKEELYREQKIEKNDLRQSSKIKGSETPTRCSRRSRKSIKRSGALTTSPFAIKKTITIASNNQKFTLHLNKKEKRESSNSKTLALTPLQPLIRKSYRTSCRGGTPSVANLTPPPLPLPQTIHSPLLLKPRRVLEGHSSKIYNLDWSSDSRYIATVGQDATLFIWDALYNKKRFRIKLASSWIIALGMNHMRGKQTVGDERRHQQYSASNVLHDSDMSSSNVCFVLSGGLDNTCTLHGIHQGNESTINYSHQLFGSSNGQGMGNVADFQSYHEFRNSYERENENNMGLLHTGNTVQSAYFLGHEGYISSCVFMNATRSQILTTSGDSTARVWDVATQTTVQTLHGHRADVMSSSLSPITSDVLLTSSDINSVKFLSNGYTFVTGSDDASCLLYDLRTGKVITRFCREQDNAAITSIDVSNSGRLLFAACDNPAIKVYDMWRRYDEQGDDQIIPNQKSTTAQILYTDIDSINSQASDYGLRGKRTRTAKQSEKNSLFSTTNTEQLGSSSLYEGGGHVSSIRMSPDGTALGSASWNSRCIVWA
eukprot:g1130.t1